MILVALGSNIESRWGSPSRTIKKALRLLDKKGCRVIKCSSLFETAPLGRTDQPDFVNAVVQVDSELAPESMLALLHDIEAEAGRRRGETWGPRALDLDLLDVHGLIRAAPPPVLPHPGMEERPFVLAPIEEIAPEWRHPINGRSAGEMLALLSGRQEGAVLRKLGEAEG
ncbi:MAG TPA: 2-amino-4-hydroxy-6-hydroxymethyldihydropteridine diphosphokinase [Aestuariivirgaceae bacterium]|jgi:2-amino-4-hydroxy-6-hydroxymethyldihydropteridine diphosphokinase